MKELASISGPPPAVRVTRLFSAESEDLAFSRLVIVSGNAVRTRCRHIAMASIASTPDVIPSLPSPMEEAAKEFPGEPLSPGPIRASVPSLAFAPTPTPPPDFTDESSTQTNARKRHFLDGQDLENRRPPPLPPRHISVANRPGTTGNSLGIFDTRLESQHHTYVWGEGAVKRRETLVDEQDTVTLGDPEADEMSIYPEAPAMATDSAERTDTVRKDVGILNWESRRTEWNRKTTPDGFENEFQSRHASLDEVTPNHYDAVYTSLVTAQRKFTKWALCSTPRLLVSDRFFSLLRPMPLSFVTAVLVHGWKKEGLFNDPNAMG